MAQIEKNMAVNLKRIRQAKNMSLDMLAEQTGVSKSMLGQIERGESNPTISTIGKIVEGLKVSFEQLLKSDSEAIVLPAPEEAPVYRKSIGQYCVHTLLPYDAGKHLEIYKGCLEEKGILENPSHGEGTWEYVTVLQGEIDVVIEGEAYHLEKGASLYFACDRKHSYQNRAEGVSVVNMIITG